MNPSKKTPGRTYVPYVKKKKAHDAEVDSDFEILFDSINKGKVTREILKNCELMYVCKTCRNIYTQLDKYTEHYDSCIQKKENENTMDPKLLLNCEVSEPEEDEGPTILLNGQTISVKDLPKAEGTNTIQFRFGLTKSSSGSSKQQLVANKLFHCKKCGGGFQAEFNLKRHMLVVHSSFRRYKCNFCEYRSNLKNTCMEHFNAVHPGAGCDDFDQMFSKAQLFNSSTGEVVYSSTPAPSASGLVSKVYSAAAEEFSADEDDDDEDEEQGGGGEDGGDRDNEEEKETDIPPEKIKSAINESFKTIVSNAATSQLAAIKVKKVVVKQEPADDDEIREEGRVPDFENVVIKVEPPDVEMAEDEAADQEGQEDKVFVCLEGDGKDDDRDNDQVTERYIMVITDEQEKLIDIENFKCLVCDKTFPKSGKQVVLRHHLAIKHLGYNKFKCKSCDYTSNCNNECMLHALDAHNMLSMDHNLKRLFWKLNCRKQSMMYRRTYYDQRDWNTKRNFTIRREDIEAAVVADTNPPPKTRQGIIIMNEEASKFVDNEDLTCVICKSGYKFTHKWSLRTHVAVTHFAHLGYKRYGCRLCDFQSNFLHECRKHLVQFHEQGVINSHNDVLKMFKQNSFEISKPRDEDEDD